MKRIPVFLDYVYPVRDIRFLRKKTGDALDIGLNGDETGQRLDDALDRVEHLQRVGHEDGKRSDLHQPLQRQAAALPENK